MLGRAVARLAVIVGFLIYVYAANVYVAQTYFKEKSAGPAVPITQQIQQSSPDDNAVHADSYNDRNCGYSSKHSDKV
jgi:hypothetical protein